MYNLFLDDLREVRDVSWVDLPLVEWIIVRSYQELVAILDKRGIPKLITYDCDLDESHYTSYFNKSYLQDWPHFKVRCGIDCCMELIERCKKNNVRHPAYFIHTMNLVGKNYIQNLIDCHNAKFPEIH